MQRIAEHLEHGDSRAAIVVSTDPALLIAAYTDELDCVAMLRLPKEPLVSKYSLLRGSRLLTVNTYKHNQRLDSDLIPGPLAIPRWSGFDPIIADFVTDDMERVEARKAQITSIEWERTQMYVIFQFSTTYFGFSIHAYILHIYVSCILIGWEWLILNYAAKNSSEHLVKWYIVMVDQECQKVP